MSPHTIKHTLVLVFFHLIVLACAINALPSSYRYYAYDEVNVNMSVAFVNNYMSAIIWKDVSRSNNITSMEDVEHVMKKQNSLKIVFISSETKLNKLWTGVSNSFYKSNIVKIYSIEKGSCFRYHVLEDFDIILANRNLFLERFRIFKKSTGNRKPSNQAIQTSDFEFIDLYPYTVAQLNASNSDLNLTLSNVKPTCDGLMQSFEYEPSLFNAYSIVHSDSLIRSSDLAFLRKWNNFEIKQLNKYNQQIILNDIYLSYYFNSTTNQTDFESQLLPSTCSVCMSDFCGYDLEFSQVDYWNIPQAIIVLSYLILLIFSGVYTQPSIKRRMAIPFLPIVLLYFQFALSDSLELMCSNVLVTIIGLLLTFVLLSQIATYSRLYYLRNLYNLFSKSKQVNARLSGTIPGLILTVVIPFFLSFIFALPYSSVTLDVSQPKKLIFNIALACYIGICCIIGLVVISIDGIINRKRWREKGIAYMLFFDDPFLVRIDMMLLSLCLILIILIGTVGSLNRHLSYFLRTMIFLFCCFISGGQCIVKYSIDRLTSWKNESNESVFATKFEEYMKHDDFKKIMREYTVKELSLENYNFFLVLQDLKTKSNRALTLQQMIDVEKEYLSPVGSFELNVSSNTKKSFHTLKKTVTESSSSTLDTASTSTTSIELDSTSSKATIKIQDLVTVFEYEVLANLHDTFSRLEKTNEFTTWLQVYTIQKQNNII
ncbi:predicted protein [Naegleria gruberi]|uniref:Predicted protein n=1 Tax=Naegleria gruberi TaxID=5762 RepID=D2VBX8_NAEGR|nr:uncharacterized protein NAEGRDRAFT_66373 [Naegleria gruberi]EFC45556.1 predicted protein [Naegleria gruberi]|eukprot:XP_002678300.1 predicted protein [Naegleria gruberi strain NEG-M]